MNKKKVMRFFLLGELLLFGLFYYHGAHGLKAVYALQDENKIIEQDMQKKHEEIAHIEQEIELWKNDSFYKEKLAREHLHMARNDEEVYLIR